MDRRELIETAGALPEAGAAAAQAYAAARETMVAEVNRIMRARADVERLVGPDNEAMMENNHANHARFLETILAKPDPTVLVDTVLWVFRAYRSHGFALAYWPAQLNAWVDVMKSTLAPEHAGAIYPTYEWLIVRQAAFADVSQAQLAESPGPEPAHG